MSETIVRVKDIRGCCCHGVLCLLLTPDVHVLQTRTGPVKLMQTTLLFKLDSGSMVSESEMPKAAPTLDQQVCG